MHSAPNKNIIRNLSIIFLCIALSFLLYETSYDIFTNENYSKINNTPNLPAERKDHHTRLSKNQIIKWNLFGASKNQSVDYIIDSAAPSKADLNVSGIVYNRNGQGWVIASYENGLEESFKTGTNIKSEIAIFSIEKEKIYIKNNGKIEAISLKEFKTKAKVRDKKQDPRIKKTSIDKVKNDSEIVRSLRKMGLERISKNSPEGYLVTSEEKEVNKKYELEKGDKILSINGYPVGSDSADALALKTYQNTGSANIEVIKEGRTIYFDYSP